MAQVVNREPQSANEYDDRTTRAVKSVLIEMGQILGSFRGKFVVIGGSVPLLLLPQSKMTHIGTMDIDLCLDPEALSNGEYARLVESLLDHGYKQDTNRRRFQLVHKISPEDKGEPITIIVDFLMPRDVELTRNDPPIIDGFAVQKADAGGLALQYPQEISITGKMPDGAHNTVRVTLASIPAFLAMKGFAINGRLKRKDAYDIYFCIRNYPGGFEQLAQECRYVLATEEGKQGYKHIADKFSRLDGFGPVSVRRFVENTDVLDGRTPDQWQQDAFGQVTAWLQALGLIPNKDPYVG